MTRDEQACAKVNGDPWMVILINGKGLPHNI